MAMGYLVLPVATRALVEACRRLGIEAGPLLERAGLSRARLDDPDARIPAEAADGMWREAFAAAGDPALAVHAAEQTPYGTFRVLDYLGATGPTLGEGLRRVAAYFPLVDPRGALEVDEGEGSVTVLFRGAGGVDLPPPAQEYTLGILHLRIRHMTSPRWRPEEVRFTFPRPPGARAHVRLFGVEPRYGAAAAALVLGRTTWDRATSASDPGLFAALDAHARALLERAAGAPDLVSRVRASIGGELPGREPSLAAVARRVGLSRRSLQRRLQEAGTPFGRLVDAVRRERAEAFLRAPDVSIAEVSWLLGFSEQSAFTRAFRRWTGEPPAGWRDRQRGGGTSHRRARPRT